MPIREIYIRNPQDPKYISSTIIDYDNEIESIIQRLKVLLGTNKGEVLGSYDFGINIEDYIFTTDYNARMIEDEINAQIQKYIKPSYPGYNITSRVMFGHHDDGYDYSIIDIYIDGNKIVGFAVM